MVLLLTSVPALGVLSARQLVSKLPSSKGELTVLGIWFGLTMHMYRMTK